MSRKRDPNAPAKPRGRPPRVALPVSMPNPVPDATKPANWGDFRRYVQEHGDTIIRARYPGVPESLIDTIWRGVPVEDAEKAACMSADKRWHDF